MKAYRLSVNLKLGLIIFAVIIAIASLAYTSRFVDRLLEREQSVIEVWASALAQVPVSETRTNPYIQELYALETFLLNLPTDSNTQTGLSMTPEQRGAYHRAIQWAQSMPSAGELNFIASAILFPNTFKIPTIVSDEKGAEPFVSWRNLPIPSRDSLSTLPEDVVRRYYQRLQAHRSRMDDIHPPIPIIAAGGNLNQNVHYGESVLVKEIRLFPYFQLLFVGLFILIGYVGFSYVRRSEQSSLWVGMAKEAAHQLGTPISSLMGWSQLLRTEGIAPHQQEEALNEVDKDIYRLKRVAGRFSDIGSLPKLEEVYLAPVIQLTAEYMRRRIPQQGKQVRLDVKVPDFIKVPLNPELFEWVIENLLKNALDAIDTAEGRIEIGAQKTEGRVLIDVRDTGKGIDRRHWKFIFRPGYSTKKRGWGLGLSLAKRIIEDYHGGILMLEQSRVGHGTTFRISLPVS